MTSRKVDMSIPNVPFPTASRGLVLGANGKLDPSVIPSGISGDTTILDGVGVPDPGLGEEGDYYLDTGSGILYGPKDENGWSVAIAPADLAPYQLRSEEGVANGYASLAADGKVPASQLPPIPPGYTLPARLAPETGYVPISDANLATLSGWYGVSSGTNLPPGYTQGHLEVYTWADVGSNVQVQFFHAFNVMETWRRYKYGSWTGWQKTFPIDDTNLPARLASGSSNTLASDWNAATSNGWYWMQPSRPNAPPINTDYILHVSNLSTIHVRQVAYAYDREQAFTRRATSGAWSAWVQIYPIDDTNLPKRLQTFAYPNVNDANLAVTSGWYSLNGGTNSPPVTGYENYCNLYVAAHDNQQITQLCFPFWSNEMFFRRMHSSTWQPWVKIYPIDNAGLPNRLKAYLVQAPSNDANQAVENGFYWLNAGSANGPTGPLGGAYFEMLVLSNDNYNVRQVAWPHDQNTRYERAKGAGTWGAWVQTYPVGDAGLPGRIQAKGPNLIGVNISTNTAITENGWYRIDQSCTGQPTPGMYGLLEHQGWEGTGDAVWATQIFKDIFTDRMWMRWNNNRTWGAWVQTWPLPAFSGDAGWTNLAYTSQFSNYGSGYAWGNYRKLAGGAIILRGLVRAYEMTGTDTIANLPAGYRPVGGHLIFNVETQTGTKRLDVNADGNIVIYAQTSNVWLSLAGVTFYPDG